MVLPSDRSMHHQKLDNKNKRWVEYNLLDQNNFLRHCNQERCMLDPTRRNCRGRHRSRHIFRFLQQRKKNIICQPCLIRIYLFDKLKIAWERKMSGRTLRSLSYSILSSGVVASKAPRDESAQQFRPSKDIDTLADHFSRIFVGGK